MGQLRFVTWQSSTEGVHPLTFLPLKLSINAVDCTSAVVAVDFKNRIKVCSVEGSDSKERPQRPVPREKQSVD
jgi:hypothetical protein